MDAGTLYVHTDLFLYVKHVAGVDYAPVEMVEEEQRGEGDYHRRVSRIPLSHRTLIRVWFFVCFDLKCVTHITMNAQQAQRL